MAFNSPWEAGVHNSLLSHRTGGHCSVALLMSLPPISAGGTILIKLYEYDVIGVAGFLIDR